MNIASEESISGGVQEILQKEKRIDVLDNNASYGSYGALGRYPFQRQDTNVKSIFLVWED